MNFKLSPPLALIVPLSILASTIGQGADVPIVHPMDAMSALDRSFLTASQAHNVPLKLIRALCYVESKHLTPDLKAVDGVAIMPSLGVCQIQYRTAYQFGYRGTVKELQLNRRINIFYATKVLGHWLKKARGNWMYAVSAYNRGHYIRSLRVAYVVAIALAMNEGR